MEAVDFAQLGRHLAVLDQHGKGAPGTHSAQLRKVAYQEDLGPGVAGLGAEPVEGEGAGQAGFVDHDQFAGFQLPTSYFSFKLRHPLGERAGQCHRQTLGQGLQPLGLGEPGGLPVELGQPLGCVLGGHTELVGQGGRRRGRGGQALHAACPVLGLPDGAQSRQGC